MSALDKQLLEVVSSGEPADVEQVKALLKKGAKVSAVDEHVKTPLHWAASRGKDDCVRLLLEKGAKVDTANKVGITPLISAAISDNNKDSYAREACVRLLLEKGANVNAVGDDDETTPLHGVVSKRYESSCVQLLLEKGANVDVRTKLGSAPLAAQRWRSTVPRVMYATGPCHMRRVLTYRPWRSTTRATSARGRVSIPPPGHEVAGPGRACVKRAGRVPSRQEVARLGDTGRFAAGAPSHQRTAWVGWCLGRTSQGRRARQLGARDQGKGAVSDSALLLLCARSVGGQLKGCSEPHRPVPTVGRRLRAVACGRRQCAGGRQAFARLRRKAVPPAWQALMSPASQPLRRNAARATARHRLKHARGLIVAARRSTSGAPARAAKRGRRRHGPAPCLTAFSPPAHRRRAPMHLAR